MADDQLLYVGQKAFIDKDGDILVLEDPVYGLDFPGGKIQIGEVDFDEALKREVREETGLEIEIGQPFDRWFFEFKKGHRNEGKKVFLVGFKCSFVSGEVILSDEHVGFEWVNKSNFEKVKEDSPYFVALKKYFSAGT